jgi:hypothetical protein
VSSLRRWLSKVPQPTHVRAVMVDGDEKTIAVDVTDSRSKWRTVEEAILALGPERVIAVNAAGDVLRAIELETDEKTDPSADVEERRENARERRTADIIDRIAMRQNEAFKLGAESTADALGQAHVKLVELVDILCQRLVGLETMTQKMLFEEKSGDSTEMLMKVIGLAQAKAAAAGTPPNGGKK